MSDQSENAPDPELLEARVLARAALEEITDPASIGAEAGFEALESRVVSLLFECTLPGYPGWRWTATLAKAGDDEPVTVLETDLLPGEDALTAPEWVPWSVRLKQYRESQARQAEEEAAAAAAAAAELSEEDDAEDSLLDNDYSDFDDEIDGLDIDGFDESEESHDQDDDIDDADEDEAQR